MTADRVDPIPDEVLTALVRQAVTVGMTVGLAPVPAPPPGMVARMPALVANGRRMFAAGVNLIAGTDAGTDADILAIDGDPLPDPAALHAIRAVYVRAAALTG